MMADDSVVDGLVDTEAELNIVVVEGSDEDPSLVDRVE